jgi:hypothetical protein
MDLKRRRFHAIPSLSTYSDQHGIKQSHTSLISITINTPDSLKMSDTTNTVQPVSSNIVNLAIAELVLYALLLVPSLWIAWRHGKPGMTAWPLFISFIGLRFVADIYQILHRNDPLVPGSNINQVTSAGSITCLTYTLIGILYETYVGPT